MQLRSTLSPDVVCWARDARATGCEDAATLLRRVLALAAQLAALIAAPDEDSGVEGGVDSGGAPRETADGAQNNGSQTSVSNGDSQNNAQNSDSNGDSQSNAQSGALISVSNSDQNEAPSNAQTSVPLNILSNPQSAAPIDSHSNPQSNPQSTVPIEPHSDSHTTAHSTVPPSAPTASQRAARWRQLAPLADRVGRLLADVSAVLRCVAAGGAIPAAPPAGGGREAGD